MHDTGNEAHDTNCHDRRNSSASQDVRQVVRNGSTPRLGWSRLWHARMWSNISKNCEKLVHKEMLKSSTVVWIKQSVGVGRRVPKFGVDGAGGAGLGGLPVVQFEKKQHKGPAKAGDGSPDISHQKKQQLAKVVEKQQKPVTMAAGAAKRIPLIRFPNRKAGETQDAKAGMSRFFLLLVFVELPSIEFHIHFHVEKSACVVVLLVLEGIASHLGFGTVWFAVRSLLGVQSLVSLRIPMCYQW